MTSLTISTHCRLYSHCRTRPINSVNIITRIQPLIDRTYRCHTVDIPLSYRCHTVDIPFIPLNPFYWRRK
ncbi:unnamed protein product [Nesidiocoris tenuis]|uniref:Uncharacterized protein n=1 Tax=Nesidiocoris tenuis TaxID=355587 RepID=A0A6H5GPD3_9HEMI|nr:unnamed protein product [Nesidiocoris tenuis]